MTYHDPEKQIPIMVNSNVEFYKAMQNNKVKMVDLEKVWLSLFQQTENYDASHLVQCHRMLYESAVSAFQEFNRKDYNERKRQTELEQELSYKDAAKYLDCSQSTIKRLVKEQKLTPEKYNRKVVKISVSQLEIYKSSCKETFRQRVTP